MPGSRRNTMRPASGFAATTTGTEIGEAWETISSSAASCSIAVAVYSSVCLRARVMKIPFTLKHSVVASLAYRNDWLGVRKPQQAADERHCLEFIGISVRAHQLSSPRR